MAERKEEENFELDKSFQELNSDGGLSYYISVFLASQAGVC